MKLFKQTLKASAIGAITAALAFGMLDAQAETVATTVTATVNNSIGFSETTALSFGTFTAKSDTADTSTILLQPDGTTTVTNGTNSRIVALSAAQVGVFDVTGAAPSTSLTLAIPTSAVTLTCGACTGSNPTFSVGTWTSTPAVGSLTTDGSGDATINVGATLSTITNANPYEDGSYSGSYSVSVNY